MKIKLINTINKAKRVDLFLFLYIILFFPLFLVVLFYSRAETHIFINKFNSKFLDHLMEIWTLLGDGIVMAILVVLLLFFRLKLSIAIFFAFATGSILAQSLKHLFFKSMARPIKYFTINNIQHDLYIVPGIDHHSWYSFPSGHTTVAFAVCLLIALHFRNRWMHLFLFIIAVGVAYSRVYLSQHFLMDVIGGSLLGIISGYFAMFISKRATKSLSVETVIDIFKK